MKLYQQQKETIHNLKEKPFKLERDIQNLEYIMNLIKQAI